MNQHPLEPHYFNVFPDGNRNAGGPQWYHYVETQNLNPELHKTYCGVSGSIVHENRKPATVRIPDGSGGFKCGEYHLCCQPCACDVMRFTIAEDFGGKTVLTIPDPCANPKMIPEEVTAFQCKNNRTQNAVHTPTDRIAIAVLQNSRVCTEPVDAEMGCAERNKTSIDMLKGGMGNLFARIATAA
jgi:hypothetical protein